MPKKIIYEDVNNIEITLHAFKTDSDSYYFITKEERNSIPDNVVAIQLTKDDIKTLIEDLKNLIAE